MIQIKINNNIPALRTHHLPEYLIDQWGEVLEYSPAHGNRPYDIYLCWFEKIGERHIIPGYVPGRGSVGIITLKIEN